MKTCCPHRGGIGQGVCECLVLHRDRLLSRGGIGVGNQHQELIGVRGTGTGGLLLGCGMGGTASADGCS